MRRNYIDTNRTDFETTYEYKFFRFVSLIERLTENVHIFSKLLDRININRANNDTIKLYERKTYNNLSSNDVIVSFPRGDIVIVNGRKLDQETLHFLLRRFGYIEQGIRAGKGIKNDLD